MQLQIKPFNIGQDSARDFAEESFFFFQISNIQLFIYKNFKHKFCVCPLANKWKFTQRNIGAKCCVCVVTIRSFGLKFT